jgi:hypothetical protein
MLTAAVFGLTDVLETPWRGLRNSISFAPPWLTASLGKYRLLE